MNYINNLRKHIGNQPLILVGSAVLVLNEKRQLLMMKRSDNDSWGVPGGAMELRETTEETARRELLEETGLSVNELMFLDVFSGEELYYRYPNGDEVYNVIIAYLASDVHGTVKLTDGEHDDFHYFELTQLPDKISPPIKPVLKRLVEICLGQADVAQNLYHGDTESRSFFSFFSQCLRDSVVQKGVQDVPDQHKISGNLLIK